MHNRLLVTGGCGFIGSAFIRMALKRGDFQGRVINLDALTYAANPHALAAIENDIRYRFFHGDICDEMLVEKICQEENIDAIIHFAAETHVDRSIESAMPFIKTNVEGTMHLLEVVRKYKHIHFHHVSTDEVYGALGQTGRFNETSHYRPNSPYSASKAASDHLVRAYANTYGISTTISHCSNNYGPFQHKEKFIPLLIHRCLESKPIPIYGDGSAVRDWLYVDDHAEAIWEILQHGQPHETYDIGGGEEMSNLSLAHLILERLAEKMKCCTEKYVSLLTFVKDRPGHDFRYAIDSSKIQKELQWKPKIKFFEGISKILCQLHRN